MPSMDGFALARRLRADPANGGLVLVAVTGWSGTEDKRAGQEAGFDHHFAKPADVAKLATILESARARQALLASDVPPSDVLPSDVLPSAG